MKDDIHPQLNKVVFIDSTSKEEFTTTSTISSKETKKIGGEDHFVVYVDISSSTHPFYTGKATLIDTAGRVDKFRARMEAAKKKQEAALAASSKKAKKAEESAEEVITRKAKENTEKKAADKALEQEKKDKTKAKAAAKREKEAGEAEEAA